MPQIETPESKFIKFLQDQLGTDVLVPKHATDVMRVTRFPGLEKREAPPQPVQQGPLDFYGQAPAPMQQAPQQPPEPEFPEGF